MRGPERRSYGAGYEQATRDFRADRNAFNDRIVAEFRANEGNVPSAFRGVPILLLHTTGAKSGLARINPLVFLPIDRGYVVFGTFGGAPDHPSWYHNLLADPAVVVEVGMETIAVTARLIDDESERARYWTAMSEMRPMLDQSQAKTTRRIPVMVLEPRHA
jgi:deazaflavin-dependent oxidoreductase (nitroreductase family)